MIISSARPTKRSSPSRPRHHGIARPNCRSAVDAKRRALGGTAPAVRSDRANSPAPPVARNAPARPARPSSHRLPSARTTSISANGIARPDRGRVRVDQRRIEIGRSKRLGQSIHRVEIRPPETAPADLRPRRLESRRPHCWSAADKQRVSVPPRPFRLDQLHPQRRHPRQCRDPVAPAPSFTTSRGRQIVDGAAHAPAAQVENSWFCP